MKESKYKTISQENNVTNKNLAKALDYTERHFPLSSFQIAESNGYTYIYPNTMTEVQIRIRECDDYVIITDETSFHFMQFDLDFFANNLGQIYSHLSKTILKN